MSVKEIIRTSGDVRRAMAQIIVDVRAGDISVDRAAVAVAAAKQITDSINAEVNVAKAQAAMLAIGSDMGKVSTMGKMVIEDSGSTPTLDGTATRNNQGY